MRALMMKPLFFTITNQDLGSAFSLWARRALRVKDQETLQRAADVSWRKREVTDLEPTGISHESRSSNFR